MMRGLYPYHVPYAFTQASWGTAGNLPEAVLNGFSTGLPIGILLGLVFKIAGSNLFVSILAHALVNSLPAMLLVQKLLGK